LITPALALALRLDHFGSRSHGLDTSCNNIVPNSKTECTLWVWFYRRYWRYASIDEPADNHAYVCCCDTADSCFICSITGMNNRRDRYRCLTEFSAWYWLVAAFQCRYRKSQPTTYSAFLTWEHVIIAGAGDAGVSIVQQMQQNPQLGFILSLH